MIAHGTFINVRKTRKCEKTKNKLEEGERSDTYLTHVCRLPLSTETVEKMDINQKLSASTLAV